MRRTWAAVPLALSLLVEGCGDQQTVATQLARAADETETAGTARMAMAMRVSHDRNVVLEGEVMTGIVDFGAQRARLTVDMRRLFAPVVSSIAPGLVLPVVEVVSVGDKTWIGVPGPDGKPFVEVDAAALAAGGAEAFNPTGDDSVVDYLRSIGGEVEEAGSDRVRNTVTKRYRFSLPLDVLDRTVPETLGAEFQRGIDELGIDALPGEAFVDGEGRLRRLQMELDLEQLDAELGGVRLLVTFDLFDFGVEADVQPPPADQVSAEVINTEEEMRKFFLG
jgi:hypothetical protein